MNALGTRLMSPFARLLVLILLAFGVSASSLAFVAVNVTIAPPALPVYAQPICPGPGYMWTPGYWAYGPDGYYWVPGTWVLAPYVGALWTPGYWGWANGFYVWRAGYWGPRVGYYGGINYGFGYTGVGFYGGYWRGGAFSYNTAVNNVNVNVVHNTYNRTVVENTTNVSRVSYNGPGGITRQATNEERVAQADRHRAATSTQMQHERSASTDRGQWASANNGNPGTMATARPAFKERGAGGPGGQNAGQPRHAQQGNAPRGGPQGHPQNVNPEMRAQGGPQHQGQGHGGERGQKQGQGGGERHEEGHGGGGQR